MPLEIWCIGNKHDKNLHDAITDYTKRISYFIKINWLFFDNYKNDNPKIVNKKETEMILNKIALQDYVICLDIQYGSFFSSEKFSKKLQSVIENKATRKILFIIGGTFGINKQLVERSNLVLKISDFTFPHQLVRLILAEQIYRALMIHKNIPYHN